jgi:hypothetical protein
MRGHIAKDLAPKLQNATSYLRSLQGTKTIAENFRLHGIVVALDREPEARHGTVVVRELAERQQRNIFAVLAAGDYDEAVAAHLSAMPITCYGELVREGRRLTLLETHGLTVGR